MLSTLLDSMMTALKMFAGLNAVLFGMVISQCAGDGTFTLHTENVTWSEAQTVCSQDGGTLLSDYSHTTMLDLMTNASASVWEGKYYSPWAWLLGCYSYRGSFEYIENKDNQMKQCVNHCHKTNFFGLQNKKCFCFDKFEEIFLNTNDHCQYECPGNEEERCGGDNAFTVYMNDICYTDSPQWKGTVSKTWSGKQCLPWASITEVKTAGVKHFPDGGAANASNFCRDPFKRSWLWCYVSQDKWETCDIPPCIKATKDGTHSCMSFRKPSGMEYQFMQEDCGAFNHAICVNDNHFFWGLSKGTWQNARDQSRSYSFLHGSKCYSMAGPRIFRLLNDSDLKKSRWFGFSREVCTSSKIVPNQMPQSCFSLSKENNNVISRVESCHNRKNFICQYASITCGENFSDTMQGSFETPSYNKTLGYGDFQRCVWTISVPENYLMSLSLDVSIENTYMCRSDFLRVFEESYKTGESFCGETWKTINTTGNNVTIEFRSDGSVNRFRGARVSWFAVPLPTLPTKASTSKLSVTTGLLIYQMTQSSHMTTVPESGGDVGSENLMLTGGTLAAVIVGLVVVIGIVVGIILFLIRRRRSTNNRERKVNTDPDLKTDNTNLPLRFSNEDAIDKDRRPSSEMYQNNAYVTENAKKDVQYDYMDSNLHATAREKADTVLVNGVSVSFLRKDGIDGFDSRSEDKSAVYNTLNEAIENRYQNHTENVYNRFNDSHEVYDHAVTLTRERNGGAMVASDMQTYDHLNNDRNTYAHTSSMKIRQDKTEL